MNALNLIQSSPKYFIHYAKRLYIMFWHELSLDKRVRSSPFVPPPDNEIKLKLGKVIFMRTLRICLLLLHILAAMGLYYVVTGRVHIRTTIWGITLTFLSNVGVICAAHRYWAHQTFKAVWPLQVFLMLCQTLTFQYSILRWVRIHRVHHKFSDTPRDPHNINAGLFFSHIGWVLIHESPEVNEELKKIPVADLKKDKLVMFQHRYYAPLVLLVCYIIPTFIPWYFWNESIFKAFCIPVSLRYILILHLTGLTNSLAHVIGKKPFDKNIHAGDSVLAWFFSFGDEGWHNYHHVFPWDYKASDYWGYIGGLSTHLLEFFAKMGWAYDLKTTSAALTIKRRLRTGDVNCTIWGWNDPNMNSDDLKLTQIKYQKTLM